VGLGAELGNVGFSLLCGNLGEGGVEKERKSDGGGTDVRCCRGGISSTRGKSWGVKENICYLREGGFRGGGGITRRRVYTGGEGLLRVPKSGSGGKPQEFCQTRGWIDYLNVWGRKRCLWGIGGGFCRQN